MRHTVKIYLPGQGCLAAQVPAVLNGGRGFGAFPLEQRPAPVQVEGVEPVVVDGQRVLQVPYRVVPPAWHKNSLSHILPYVQNKVLITLSFCSVIISMVWPCRPSWMWKKAHSRPCAFLHVFQVPTAVSIGPIVAELLQHFRRCRNSSKTFASRFSHKTCKK